MEPGSQSSDASHPPKRGIDVPPQLGFVVRIVDEERHLGSGILIAPDLVLTCWHVADGSGERWEKERENDRRKQFAPEPKPLDGLAVEIAGSDPPFPVGDSRFGTPGLLGQDRYYDLALLVLDLEDRDPPRVSPVPLAAPYGSEELRDLQKRVRTMTAYGFTSHSHRVQPKDGLLHGGPGGCFDEKNRQIVTDFTLATTAPQGMSGGPVLVQRDDELLCIGMSFLGGRTIVHVRVLGAGVFQPLVARAGRSGDAQPKKLASWLGPVRSTEPLESFLADQADELATPKGLLEEQGVTAEFAARVHVRLRVSERGPKERLQGGWAHDLELERQHPSGGWDIETLLSQPPEIFSHVGQRWLILGDPGSGKTTTLRALGLRAARGEIAGSRWTPLYLRLPRIAEKLPKDGENSWARLLVALADEYQFDTDRLELLEEERRAGRLLLLLDGLDEVRAGRERVKDWLGGLSRAIGTAGVVVASRLVPADRPRGRFLEAELRSMEQDEQVDFLRKWIEKRPADLGPCKAEDWVGLVESQPSLNTPLGLTLIGILLRGGETPEPRRRALLLQVVEHLVWGKTRPEDQRIKNPELVRLVLRELAVHLTRNGKDEEHDTAIDSFFTKLDGKLGAQLRAADPWRADTATLRAEIRDRTGVLGPYRDGGRWSFWHRSLQEALAADWLTEKKALDAQLAAVGDLSAAQVPFWGEPFAMLAEDLADDGLLLALHERGHSALALRALLSAPRARTETLLEILTLPDQESDGERRGQAILRIPELLGEAEDSGQKALDALDRLGRALVPTAEHFWSDLYHVDEALARLGARVGFQEASQERRVGLLEAHFPFPSDDELEGVGLLPLADAWREIPGVEEFQMGSPEKEMGRSEDEVQHPVTLSGFRMMATAVTWAQFDLFVRGHECFGSGDAPITDVDWYQALLYSRWLGARIFGRPASLPTEAQWEWACRGRSRGRFWSGETDDSLARVGWYSGNSGYRVHAVGEKPVDHPFGLHDMHGNVLEWCLDWYGPYSTALETDPEGPPIGEVRVMRGGAFYVDADWCRSAYRNRVHPGYRDDDVGFRVVLPAAPERR